ncbi:kti12, chromatin associated [Entomophthora muscae]|uniref:Kti12, chromatin associated n=1 Tax=Entomophthora muscae TaxID=34485 RepID=A0ACC2SC88_9FUNG|nr:kti12, chromatin associated [Entomophthora muscae]
MPLIVICGYPCSGKTQKAKLLEEYFNQEIALKGLSLKVHRFDDDALGFNKESYQNQHDEKKLRGAILAAAERHLTKDDVVILDSNNYIKGLRYQLYCISKAIPTPHCVIHVGTPKDLTIEWNANREYRYTDQTLLELLNRFEEPIGANRWDAPLFTSIYDDVPALPFEDIWEAVINKKPPSQTCQPFTNYLYELDRVTNQLSSEILSALQEGAGESGLIRLPSVASVPLNLRGRHLTIVELKRLRRMFMQINKTHHMNSISLDRIPELFVEYLNTSFNS